jgi:hypothetical protein
MDDGPRRGVEDEEASAVRDPEDPVWSKYSAEPQLSSIIELVDERRTVVSAG